MGVKVGFTSPVLDWMKILPLWMTGIVNSVLPPKSTKKFVSAMHILTQPEVPSSVTVIAKWIITQNVWGWITMFLPPAILGNAGLVSLLVIRLRAGNVNRRAEN